MERAHYYFCSYLSLKLISYLICININTYNYDNVANYFFANIYISVSPTKINIVLNKILKI